MTYRKTIFPRKTVTFYESTYTELSRMKYPHESWDDFMARICGVRRRR